MTDSQKLNAERSRLELEMKAMHNAAEGRAWTPEEEAKFNAVVDDIVERYNIGQPVLVGRDRRQQGPRDHKQFHGFAPSSCLARQTRAPAVPAIVRVNGAMGV